MSQLHENLKSQLLHFCKSSSGSAVDLDKCVLTKGLASSVSGGVTISGAVFGKVIFDKCTVNDQVVTCPTAP